LHSFAEWVVSSVQIFCILDKFDPMFFLAFDATYDEESKPGTVDILVVPTGVVPWERGTIRVVRDANKFGVMRMLGAIGIQRFSDQTKSEFYKLTNPLR
jgi:hypothetical protein